MPTLSKLSKDAFHSETTAFEYLRKPSGRTVRFARIAARSGRPPAANRPGRKEGKRAARMGLWKCNEKECRKQFTVKVGYSFRAWAHSAQQDAPGRLFALLLEEGLFLDQLHRVLGITYKAAWFLSHRIREAMRDGSLSPLAAAARPSRSTKPRRAGSKARPSVAIVGMAPMGSHGPNPCRARRCGPKLPY